MVAVNLWSGLRSFAGGKDVVEVEGNTIGQVLDALVTAYPGLGDVVENGVSVAVDGRIIASDLTHPISPDSDVFLMQRLRGG